jgi:type II secretory pathway component PulJ
MLDSQLKIASMKKNSASVAAWKREYDRLRKSLAQIGYISQGSVLERSVATSGRSGYQWTRKVAQKTITVSLSQPQFAALKQAVQNERTLWRTIQQMEKLSRRILFASLPDTRRRKRLTKKDLGLI